MWGGLLFKGDALSSVLHGKCGTRIYIKCMRFSMGLVQKVRTKYHMNYNTVDIFQKNIPSAGFFPGNFYTGRPGVRVWVRFMAFSKTPFQT